MSTASRIVLEDGSFTLRDEETGELYHNRSGAFLEAVKNYLEPSEPGRLLTERSRVTILDACFGLGYNSFAFLEAAGGSELPAIEIEIVAIEADATLTQLLPSVLKQPCFASLVESIASGSLTAAQRLEGPSHPDSPGSTPSPRTIFRAGLKNGTTIVIDLRNQDLRKALPALLAESGGSSEESGFDLIYHDPFSPKRAAELWTLEIFQHYRRLLRSGGRLLTYSSAAAVRGALRMAGLTIYRTTAVGGKSGGTLASNAHATGEGIFALSEEEEARLASSSGVPYRDPGLARNRSEIHRLRQAEQRQLYTRQETQD